MPTTLPILNPRFLPNFPEIKDAGIVAAIKPKNCKATGKVIILTLGAICLPIKPITEISNMFPVISKA
ncbi:hypothetical protein VCRA2123E76_160045 [Vibrio crassostreae]|nr:hypothetical protein VCRA2123E76_160045 [Vibrio crassostreae]